MLTESVSVFLERAGYSNDYLSESIGGGCISQACRLVFADGRTLFLKHNESAPPDMFASEAFGLEALGSTEMIRVPEVIHFDEGHILLEDLSAAAKASGYWCDFGQQLAQMHRMSVPCFGFDIDNYCGLSPQNNLRMEDGYQFFAENRLLFQTRMAVDSALLSMQHANMIEKLCIKLPDLIPEQPPSLIHGDLWSGNAHVGPEGEPVLIDPAAYWGWAEAELAMTRLFGDFPDAFYEAYLEVNAFESGWRERMGIYNLYHLLNHLNLFGSGYLHQVLSVIKRYH